MGFFGYLIFGAMVYSVGFMINLKMLYPKRQVGVDYTIKHPTMLGLVGACWVVMLIVSWLMGRFLLGHVSIDVPFVLVNSVVATVVFYFGLNPDQTKLHMPD